MTEPDHLLANVNRMAQRLAETERTPEQKAQAVIANIKQAIVFEERKQETMTDDALSGNEHAVRLLESVIESIKSEFNLT